ncbi:MAG: type II toxin-antitoxin system HipA family toxin [Acidiferrobacterales bacterium]|nr:type II toxin-antitoxin system HipA family toxin [Acidiferrobacterales bacterium]
MTFHPVSELEVNLSTANRLIRVGRLAAARGRIFFEYDASYIEKGFELSPIRCPLAPGVKSFDRHLFEGLPGLFYDSLPDGWGRLLLDRKMRKLDVLPQQMSPLDRLAHVGLDGMGALVYKPCESADGLVGELNLDTLAERIGYVLEGESGEVINELLSLNGSSAGARPEAVIGVDPGKRKIVYGKELAYSAGYEPWLVKFANSNDGTDAGAIEYVYAAMAIDAGVDMKCVHLFPAQDNPGYFATKRFDRNQGERIHCHSVCGLLHSNFRTPSLDYQDLIRLTTVLTRDTHQAEKMFRLAVFNVLSHNRDDHSKNFSFLMDSNGEWRLSPAYDLTFSSGPSGEQSTMVLGKGKNFEIADLVNLGVEEDFNRSFIDSVIEQTRSSIANWRSLALNHGVEPDNIRLIQTRINGAAP